MSDKFNDNKDFVFIKEQIRPRKRKFINKFLFPFLTMIFMAVVFGLVAAVTFCIAEPRLYKLLHKEEANSSKNLVQATTQVPYKNNGETEDPADEPDDNDDNQKPGSVRQDEDENNNQTGDTKEVSGQGENEPKDEPQPVMVETVDADIEDYIAIYNDLKRLSYETSKSILKVTSIIQGKDWFGNPIEKTINTTGVVVENNGSQLKLLVSLDRVKDASSIKIMINDISSADAVLLDYETELNLAVIAVNIDDIPIKAYDNITVASFGESYSLMAGSPIIALGNPNGYTSSIDIGIITSKGSSVSITDNELDLFHTNMSFNSESDGVIVNLEGEIIGIITRTLKKGLNKELSTVIGISKIKPYIDRMLSQTSRIYCGVIAENLPQAAKTEYNVTNGVYVYEVIKDSPAFTAGLMSGDIILAVDERNIFNMNGFYSTISEYEPGTEVTFKIKRTSGSTDKELELKVILAEKRK
ncbi:MAG TPA: PDZ domain-containing protein [Mobilitalea sp.]|nr:PDZ domain-containing protein [Mobilitalea sp.]